jgi:lipocalin
MFVFLLVIVVLTTSISALNLGYQKQEAKLGFFGADKAVTQIDINSYLGYWYQMYADKVVIDTIEKDSFCETATYGTRDDGKISVLNYAKIGSPTGTDYTIDGYAYVADSNKPGELKVHFNAKKGQSVAPFDAPYWILDLGPIKNGQYEWAIVSDNFSQFLFVLARDYNTFNAQYKTIVDGKLEDLGFNGYKKPIAIHQGSDCIYNKPTVQAKKPVTAASTCEVITDQSTCMSSSQGDEKCSWCTSGAVGASCNTESDAKSLPASVFSCDYQQKYYLRKSSVHGPRKN